MATLDSSVGTLDVSIVIVSFNTREVLRECLESVERESAGLRVEVLVVDNNSSDGSPEMVERDFPVVKLFRSRVNLGFASANNATRMSRSVCFAVLPQLRGSDRARQLQ